MIGESDSENRVAGFKHFDIEVEGRVQGVAFRAAVQGVAGGLGIAGSVRNLENGRVLIQAEGHEAALQDLVSWCSHGPEVAQVKHVIVTEREVQGLKGFEIYYT